MSSSDGIRLSGVASGIDTSAIIEAMLAPERERITGIEEDIDLNDAKIETWKDIATELQSFGKVLNNLKSGLSTSIYNKKSVSTTDDSIITAIASSGATAASYPLDVKQLAQSQVVGMESGYTWESGDVLAQAVTFYINDSSEISIAAGATIDEVLDAINSATYTDESSRIVATKIQTNLETPAEYTMVLQAPTAEESIKIATDSSGNVPTSGAEFEVFTGTGATGAGEKNLPFFTFTTPSTATPINQVRDAKQAKMTIFPDSGSGGITVYSNTNVFDKALPNLSITAVTTGTATIEVSSDTSEIKEAVLEFVSSYNDVKGMLDRVRDVKLDEDDKFGPFFSDALLRRVSSQIRGLTTGVVRMGDESSWQGNITVTSVDSANQITLEGFTNAGAQLSSGEQIVIGSSVYTLQADATAPSSSSTGVQLTVSPVLTGAGHTAGDQVFLRSLTLEGIGVGVQTDGVSGLEGRLAVLSDGDLDAALQDNLDVVETIFRRSGSSTSSTGIATRLYNWVNQQTFLSFALSSDGQSLLNKRAIDDVKLSSLESTNTNLKNQITRIEERIEQREKLLVKQFSRMESAMSQSQSVTGALASLNGGG